MYCNVVDGQIFHSSGGLIPLHGLKPEFISPSIEALQPEDSRWNNPDADEWRKHRVADAQLRVLAHYPGCQYRLTADDSLTLCALACFLTTRLDSPLPNEGDKTIFAHKSDNQAAIVALEYRSAYWNVRPLKVLHNPTFLEMALAQKEALGLLVSA